MLAAPAIVRASSLMPVKVLTPEFGIGPMLLSLRDLEEYRAALAAQWWETAQYTLGQTVLQQGKLLTCVAL